MKKGLLKCLVFAFGMVLGLSSLSALTLVNNKETKNDDPVEYDEPNLRNFDSPDFTSVDKKLADDEIAIPTKVIINYHTEYADCDNKAFWVWCDSVSGKQYAPDTISANKKDMTLTLDFTKGDLVKFRNEVKMYIILKPLGAEDWTGQTADTPIDYRDFPPDENGTTEVFIIPGEGNALEVYASQEETKASRVQSFYFTDWKTIQAKCSGEPSQYKLYAFDRYYLNNKDIQETKRESYLFKSSNNLEVTFGDDMMYYFNVNLNSYARPNLQYYIEVTFPNNTEKTRVMVKGATFERLYNSKRFHDYYEYKGSDLGAKFTEKTTTFKVWAPTAYTVQLLIYVSGTPTSVDKVKGNDVYRGYDMQFQPGGIWMIKFDSVLVGKYYNYQVLNSLGSNVVVDPYAKSAGINGVRGFLPDFSKTNPTGWSDLKLKWDGVEGYDIKSANELSVYEVQIRDLTADDSWTGKSKRGTYSAFSESGTKYNGVSTGFDHIVDLAPRAIQILPFYDRDNDEVENPYNWGYDPLNYNVLEGSFATDPYDGYARIKEFKQLVYNYATSKSKIRVIMDVVYNHVFSLGSSNFNKLMPRYYFRYNQENWSPWNSSGCGNEVKTEAPMMRKFIIESLCFWAREYKIKGFRFDLMGVYDVETLKLAAEKLYAIDPDIVMYGEGWDATWDDPFHGEGYDAATGNVYKYLYPTSNRVAVGGFNDGYRDSMRGKNDPGYGYLQKVDNASENQRYAIACGLWGIYKNEDGYSAGANPAQTVNYVSCHDNFTLYDQLYMTLGDGTNAPSETNVKNASVAAHAFTMASNGIGFMLGGEEIFRSKTLDSKAKAEVKADTYTEKYGRTISHNSYNSPDSVNSFKWGNKVQNISYYEEFKSIIKLHSTMRKYAYSEPFPYSTTTSGHQILGITWGDKIYCSGFQLDDYFVYLAGKEGGSVSGIFNTKLYSFGNASVNNGSINLGAFSFAIYKR